MKQLELRLKLRANTIFTTDASTEGGHQSLDYIPGSAIHGAVSARLYANATLDQRTRYELLHSGRVRFSDGFPCHGENVGWPVPFCWYHPKTKEPDEQGKLKAECINNFQWASDLGLEQPKQMRNGYVTDCGHYLKLSHESSLKTAIDPETGRARESQLFAYDALQAGQEFSAFIQWDDEIGYEDVESLIRGTIGHDLLLGRSRSAEFGAVDVRWMDTAPVVQPLERVEGNGMTLWLVSDLVLTDDKGFQTLRPAPEYFGIESGYVDWNRTFLRTRRYAPYNAYRGVRDEDRAVIMRGSVIHISGAEAADYERLAQYAAGGLGLYREQGMGQVLVNPTMLSTQHPRFEASTPVTSDTPARLSHPLLDWLETQEYPRQVLSTKALHEFGEMLLEVTEKGRNIMGLNDDTPCGPSVSQWGTVYSRAISCPSDTAIKHWLFESDHPVARQSSEGWSDICLLRQGQKINFLKWFTEKIDEKSPEGVEKSSEDVALMAREARERIQDGKRGRRSEA